MLREVKGITEHWNSPARPTPTVALLDNFETRSSGQLFFLFVYLFIFAILGLHPQHMEGSQARGQIRAEVAGLHHSHSNTGSKPCPQSTPQLTAMSNPQPTERGQGSNRILTGSSQIH